MIDGRDFKELNELDGYLWRSGDYVRVYTTYDGSEIFVAEWQPMIDGESDCYEETKRFALDKIEDCVEYALARHDEYVKVWDVE